MSSITEARLKEARNLWGEALVAISNAFDEEGLDAARQRANEALDIAYGYHLGPVLFKPTMVGGAQTFRTTREGALSYFIGHNEEFPQDGGFGLKSWRQVASSAGTAFIESDIALWMGHVTFTNSQGEQTVVDKSWGYKQDQEGQLRIVLHHSSLPFEV